MQKKKNLTNRVVPTAGGWASIRSLKYAGISTVHDEPYHTVHALISNGEWDEMLVWCQNTFGLCSHEKGPGVWTPSQRWYINNSKFWFRDKGDLEWFMLTWG